MSKVSSLLPIILDPNNLRNNGFELKHTCYVCGYSSSYVNMKGFKRVQRVQCGKCMCVYDLLHDTPENMDLVTKRKIELSKIKGLF